MNQPAPEASAADAPIPARFEDAVAELEALVTAMESGKLSLEDSLSHFHRGSVLLKHCRSTLETAEQRIRILQGESLQDLDPAADKT